MSQAGGAGATVAALFQRLSEANEALLNGQAARYLAQVTHAPDFVLMTPFGGLTRGFDGSEEGVAELSRFFQGGSSTLELVQAYVSGDLAVLVTIEHQRAAVGGLAEQDWSLRVTQVFRQEGPEWCLVHRHADPLVRRIPVEQSAALARG